VGTSEIANAVAGARASGMLDFHRISPQSPVATAAGFILGAPIREWVLTAVTIPFSIGACCTAKPGPLGGLVVFVVLIASALLFHTIALLVGTTTPASRSTGGPVALLVFILHSTGATLPVALFTVVPTAMAVMGVERPGLIRDTFYMVKLPVPLLSLLHILPMLALVFIAGVRRMRSERVPIYSKLQAVAFQAAMAFLVLGDVLGLAPFEGNPSFGSLIGIYLLSISGALLSLACTPGAGEYAKGIWRACKQGLAHPGAWEDRAANWQPVAALVGIMMVAGLLASAPEVMANGLEKAGAVLASLVVAAAAVVTVASGRQAFGLRYRKAGAGYLGLFFFVVWVLPIIVGALLEASKGGLLNSSSEAMKYAWALSPLTGIGIAGNGEAGTVLAIVASVIPAAVMMYLSREAEQQARKEAQEGRKLAA
ncbi:MAG: hypothetical protein ABFD96_03510, partial [Armatimonadia bacterium]